MQKHPPYQDWKPAAERLKIARKVLAFFSDVALDQLCADAGIVGGKCIDGALNSLWLDAETSAKLLKEVRKESPCLKVAQGQCLLMRCFRRKVNALRCIGHRTLRPLLEEIRQRRASQRSVEGEASPPKTVQSVDVKAEPTKPGSTMPKKSRKTRKLERRKAREAASAAAQDAGAQNASQNPECQASGKRAEPCDRQNDDEEGPSKQARTVASSI
mmetsp:Transcript_35342/g.53128  ORF Transcript_35342/g.53128 Transcript_35342/m.53128 type:complete len:215 (+) Transcript_35342:6-650(+)